MKKIFILSTLFLFFLNSCSDNDDIATKVSNCDQQAQIVEEGIFNTIETYNYQISNVVLNQDCLEITIWASGCDANNWEMKLFSHNNFSTVIPLQRFAKIELINNEICLAIFQKTVSFDLAPFQVQGQNQVPINLEGWSEQIIYQY